MFFEVLRPFNSSRFLILSQLVIYSGYLAQGAWLNWSTHKPKFCLKDDNYTRPNNDPINVYAGVTLTAIFDIEESKMEFGIQIYMRALWKEPMLGLEGIVLKETYTIPDYVSECIWHPDLIFPNAKDARLYDETIPNSVLKLQKNGYIYKYGRYKILLICNMIFKLYPMDTQFCTLDISFLASRNNEARLSWQEDSKDKLGKNLKIYGTIEPLQFSLKSIRNLSEDFEYTSGNTTILKVLFEFYRPITASLVNTYVPSFLIVCLSWVSFWLEANAVPGRVTLGVTALCKYFNLIVSKRLRGGTIVPAVNLTLATQVVHARSGLPSLSYMTAIDVWLFGCLVMVFISLIEFTMVQTCFRKNARVNKKPLLVNVTTKPSSISNTSIKNVKDDHLKPCRPRQSTKNAITVLDSKSHNIDVTKGDYPLDRVSRIVFPLAMLIFSVLYWTYFLRLASKVTYQKK